jgi:hypothetical protein
MGLKLMIFAVLYLFYVVVVFIVLGLIVYAAYQLHLEQIVPIGVLMIGLLLLLVVLLGLPFWFLLNQKRSS